jgi:hypothetical protein
MTPRIPILAVSLVSALISAPAYLRGQQASQPQQRDQYQTAGQPAQTAGDQQRNMMNMMANMKATDQKLDELVKKMNASRGTEKTDAMAEVVTLLAQDHRAMHEAMMSHMSSMMNMGTMHGRGDAPTTPKK